MHDSIHSYASTTNSTEQTPITVSSPIPVPPNITDQVLQDLEYTRETLTDRESELTMSVNQWTERVKTATVQAHQAARQGLMSEEYNLWLEAAAACIGRAEFVLQRWQEEGI